MDIAGRTARFEHALKFAQNQLQNLVQHHPGFLPTYTVAGRWLHRRELWTDWCGGFLAGMMWRIHQHTGAAAWRTQAERYSRLLEHRKLDRNVHDLGFIFLNTFRHWYETTGDESRMDVVAEAGVTLAGRFQENGQYLASFLGPQSLFIDIMMNVPLLFVAADWLERRGPVGTTHDAQRPTNLSASELRRQAVAHCLTSQKYLVRADGSSVHEAIFDPATGQFLRESTQQGLLASSCWSRGLAWAMYGFGTVYAQTRDPQFLETATRCADWFLEHLPADHIPNWDFEAPEHLERVRDSSAAAIAASGLLQLADLTQEIDADTRHAARYRNAAFKMLDVLCSDQFLAASTPGWEGILMHAVYHMPKNLGVDESVMWGDYFFVEALIKAMDRLKAGI